MSHLSCEYVRDVYPDVMNGIADAALIQSVRAHIAECDDCRADVALLEALHAHQPSVPGSLHERVATAVAQRRGRQRFSRSNMAMAATLAAALIGGSVILQTQQRAAGRPETTRQAEAPLGVGFVGVEDAVLSGQGSLDDLSVEQLEKLLEEIES